MPDKDGDEGKSTKSVVNKKQKQMMGEEGYDIARDMGRVRPSKDKKDATTMPPSKEMEKTRKVNKGPSAFERVKKKYKGQIMKVEELDLTQVAEAFGGYIVEKKDDNDKPKFSSGSFDPANQEGKFVKNEKKKRLRTDIQKKQDAEISARKKEQVKQRASALDPRRPGFEDEEGQGVGFNAPTVRARADAEKEMSSGTRKFSGRQQADMSKLLGTIAGTEGGAKGTVRRLSRQQRYERDSAKLEAGRKAYLDPKTGKASPEGIKRYISKARQMRTGSNEPVDQKTTDVIATSAGQDYAKKIEDKYGGRRARKRGSNQPSYDEVKSKVDAKNPTVRALMPAGSGKPLPDKTRKTVDKDLGDNLSGSFKDFLNRSKGKSKEERDKINQALKNNPDDVNTQRVEREAEKNKDARSAVERQSGTKIRDYGLPRGTVTPGNETPLRSVVSDTERIQQSSVLGAVGGFLTKSAAPASAGIEAAQRYKAGDKRGAAISAVQAMDIPVLSKAAGVVNVIRSLRQGKEIAKQQSKDMTAAQDKQKQKGFKDMAKAVSDPKSTTKKGAAEKDMEIMKNRKKEPQPQTAPAGGDGGGQPPVATGTADGGGGALGGGDLSDVLAANLPKVGEKIRSKKFRIPKLVGGRAINVSAKGGGAA